MTRRRPLRLAVIGAGARSGIALHAVESGDGAIVAVADPSETARERAAERFGSPLIVSGHRELIAAVAAFTILQFRMQKRWVNYV